MSSQPMAPGRESRDAALVRALQEGDERAFTELVGRWSGMMLRVALARVRNRAVAEEVVQEAWLTVLGSLDRFARRSTLRTWVVGIVVNLARSRARVESRSVPLEGSHDGTVDPGCFLPPDHPRWPGHWAAAPAPWPTPEEELVAGEARRAILEAIDALPSAQREVLVLRDLEGLPAAEVCEILELTDANQRVLLHRARARLRRALEAHFERKEPA